MKKTNVVVSASQAIQGMEATLRNAEALLQEAKILLDAGHPVRATALAAMAYEESAKIIFYGDAHRYASKGEMDKWWKMFSTHQDKILTQDLATLTLALDDMEPGLIALIVSGDYAKHMNAAKIKALYTDFDGDQFVCPLDRSEIAEGCHAIIEYVEATLQRYRILVPKITAESLAGVWQGSGTTDQYLRIFEGKVKRRLSTQGYVLENVPEHSGPGAIPETT